MNARRPNSMLLLLTLCAVCVRGEQSVRLTRVSNGEWSMENGPVRVVLSAARSGYADAYYARSGREWKLILRAGAAERADLALYADGTLQRVAMSEIVVAESSAFRVSVSLRGVSGIHTVTKTITLEGNDPFVRVDVQDRIDGLAEVAYLLSTYSFVPGGAKRVKPDFTWTPQLRPDPDDVIADHTFRSPALVFQRKTEAAALVPAVERIIPWRSIETSADLRQQAAEGPFFSYGAMNWRQRSHVFYTHSDKMTTQFFEGQFWYGFFLYVDAAAPDREGYRTVVRFQWERVGRKHFLDATGPQQEPLPVYERRSWAEYVPMVALDTVEHGTPVSLLRQGRLAWSNKLHPAANNDCWFTVWFNALRTAYGLHQYGTTRGDSTMMNRAERVLNLALLAPQRGGLSPGIFYVDSAGGHWVGDQGWGGIKNGKFCSVANNAWTGYWLLQWLRLAPNRKDDILRHCGGLADFLVTHQLPSGVIPSWFDPNTLEAAEVCRDLNAETAASILFLAAWYEQCRDSRYLHSAERGMAYIREAIVPQRKWVDFETFFSCSRKPVGFYDVYTGQYAQNTLMMDQTAAACLLLYRLTGNTLYRELGTSTLDYLLQYQQVWSPPWLSRQLFGGFGVQNTDGEWSDSRQGYFAVTLMDYFDLTGEREYLERGVAAARAMFSLFESPGSPRTGENYAHSARDRLGGVTGIHWGTGSSAVSLGIMRGRYGDALVDVAGGWGVGIDGCRITGVEAHSGVVSIHLADNIATPRTLNVRFRGVEAGTYEVQVNGNTVGTFSREQLEGGIPVGI